MTKKKLKALIKTGDKLAISQAIFIYWKLDKRQLPIMPYKD